MPIEQRWHDLEAGLYAPSRTRLPEDQFFDWVQTKNAMMLDQIEVLQPLVSRELVASWGPPGQPGSVEQIKRICGYLADACARMLEWEEGIRSVRISEPFSDLVDVYKGAMGHNIASVANIRKTLELMIQLDAEGHFHYTVEMSVPPEFAERSNQALERIREHMGLDLLDDD